MKKKKTFKKSMTGVKGVLEASYLLHTRFLVGLLFKPDDGGNMFL
jgi:hypothetical protein